MKFFLPAATSEAQAEQVYGQIKEFLSDGDPALFSERRICALSWRHDGRDFSAQVGEQTSFNGEPVIAILYDPLRDLYHVCTPNRGVVRGNSILAGGHIVFQVTDFEA